MSARLLSQKADIIDVGLLVTHYTALKMQIANEYSSWIMDSAF